MPLDEYRKYQVRTLTPVEQAHIAQLEAEAKKAKEKKGKNKRETFVQTESNEACFDY